MIPHGNDLHPQIVLAHIVPSRRVICKNEMNSTLHRQQKNGNQQRRAPIAETSENSGHFWANARD